MAPAPFNVFDGIALQLLFLIIHFMKPGLHENFRARRLALGLSQAEAARRSGIQQRQVSTFERGGDVTISTLMKLAQALDVEIAPIPREDTAKVESLLKAKRGQVPSVSAPLPSLLERYRVKDDEEPSHG
jgi:transcriptional regulator with XRE-family HTH domain